jgi:hypothetical protein
MDRGDDCSCDAWPIAGIGVQHFFQIGRAERRQLLVGFAGRGQEPYVIQQLFLRRSANFGSASAQDAIDYVLQSNTAKTFMHRNRRSAALGLQRVNSAEPSTSRKLRQSRFVIDGEAVILWVDGISDFDAPHSGQHNDEVQLCAFDVLAEGGDDLRKLPLSMRKANLERLLARRPEGLFINPFECDEIGPDLFRAA